MSSIGGSNAATELASISKDLSHVRPISGEERQQRREKAARLMQERGVAALVLSASTSLYYFTGLSWYQSERLVGAILTSSGKLIFISPAFEDSKLRETLGDQADIRLWEEDESPYALVEQILKDENLSGNVALDEAAPFFIADGLRQALASHSIVNGMLITAECRMHKSANEIALMQAAKNITLEVQRRT
ncbi:aminopeptidase P family N-terminal domain-containing protein, partial [Undibacterium sp.]|uniref:aminopeptidase P family N-terminal domain-containing protein n=1 Tax=Undibacterium sp. TaxID=1914977 RepID=UPI0037509108